MSALLVRVRVRVGVGVGVRDRVRVRDRNRVRVSADTHALRREQARVLIVVSPVGLGLRLG